MSRIKFASAVALTAGSVVLLAGIILGGLGPYSLSSCTAGLPEYCNNPYQGVPLVIAGIAIIVASILGFGYSRRSRPQKANSEESEE